MKTIPESALRHVDTDNLPHVVLFFTGLIASGDDGARWAGTLGRAFDSPSEALSFAEDYLTPPSRICGDSGSLAAQVTVAASYSYADPDRLGEAWARYFTESRYGSETEALKADARARAKLQAVDTFAYFHGGNKSFDRWCPELAALISAGTSFAVEPS